jgi:excisionase family DNA binding protein
MLAHHIKERKLFPREALRVENGITLCTKCHKQEPYQFWFLGCRLKNEKNSRLRNKNSSRLEVTRVIDPKTECLTANDAAQIFDVHTATMRRWLNKGILPGIKIGGLWRIRVEDIKLNPQAIAKDK